MLEAFRHELDNHEYCITHEPMPALNALCLTAYDVNVKPNLKHGFELAVKDYQ